MEEIKFKFITLAVLAICFGFLACQFVDLGEAIPGVVAVSQLKSLWFFMGAAGAILFVIGVAKVYDYVTTRARNKKIFDALKSEMRRMV